jgi:hypothetical protein
LDGQLKRFWEQEEICTPIMTPEEHSCEEYFNATTIRTTEGRYVVRLPLNSQESSLGDSYEIAKQRLLQLERQLTRQPRLRQ